MAEIFTDEAHVLFIENTGETSLRLRLLTKDHGLITARAKGVRVPGHAWGSVLDLFRTVEVTAALVAGIPLCYLRDARLLRNYPQLTVDPLRLHCVSYATRLVEKAIVPLAPCPALYELYEKFLMYVVAHPPEWRVVNRFERRLLIILGHDPDDADEDSLLPLLVEHCHADPVSRLRLLRDFTMRSTDSR